MWLNDEQLSVIKEVRTRMGDKNLVPRFICALIGIVLRERVRAGVLSADSAGTIKNQLSSAITSGIGGMVTFGGFMIASCPVLRKMHDGDWDVYDNAIHLARMAWLDKILETREIAAEKLEFVDEECLYAKAE